METLSKAMVVKELAEKTEMTQKATKEILEALQEVVYTNLKAGNTVKILDGITLSSKHVDATERRNPATGETFMAAPCEKPVCKFGKAIKDAINA